MNFPLILTSLAYCMNSLPQVWIPFLCLLCVVIWYHLCDNKNWFILNLPIVRVLPCLLLNAHRVNDWLVDVFNNNGSTLLLRGPVFTGLEFLITCDPQNIEYITRTNFANFPKGPEYIEMFEVLGDGMFNVDAEKWRPQRRMAHMRFGSSDFRSFYARTSQEVAQKSLVPILTRLAKQGHNIDLQDVILRYTFDVAIIIILGKNPNYLSPEFPRNEFADAADSANDAVFYRIITPTGWWRFLRWLNVSKENNVAKACKTIDCVLQKFISGAREDLHSRGKGSDLLSSYLHPSKADLEDEEIRNQLLQGDKFLRDSTLNFLFAGRDSTGTGLNWLVWIISKTPRVKAKILEELGSVFSEKERDGAERPFVFSLEDVKALVYLHATVCESLRLYPPIHNDLKTVAKDDVLPDGTVVRPGMRLIYSIYCVGRMKWIWGDDALEFKPERWINENGKVKYESVFKFPVFNAGPRSCLGKDMAISTMKVAASAIIFNFDVQLVEGHPISWKPSTGNPMKHGMMAKVIERAISD